MNSLESFSKVFPSMLQLHSHNLCLRLIRFELKKCQIAACTSMISQFHKFVYLIFGRFLRLGPTVHSSLQCSGSFSVDKNRFDVWLKGLKLLYNSQQEQTSSHKSAVVFRNKNLISSSHAIVIYLFQARIKRSKEPKIMRLKVKLGIPTYLIFKISHLFCCDS